MADDIVSRLKAVHVCLEFQDCLECGSFGRHRNCLCPCHDHVWLEAAEEITQLREWLERTYRLAVGHGPNWMVFDGWEEAIRAYEEARRG